MTEDKTLICPNCRAYSLEVDQSEEEDDGLILHHLHCFNCGFRVTDEQYQSMAYNDQDRIDVIGEESELPNIIQSLNINLLEEELERQVI